MGFYESAWCGIPLVYGSMEATQSARFRNTLTYVSFLGSAASRLLTLSCFFTCRRIPGILQPHLWLCATKKRGTLSSHIVGGHLAPMGIDDNWGERQRAVGIRRDVLPEGQCKDQVRWGTHRLAVDPGLCTAGFLLLLRGLFSFVFLTTAYFPLLRCFLLQMLRTSECSRHTELQQG